MNQVTVTQTSFEELGLPQTIYKYRTWTDPLHLSIITAQKLFMASPRDFKDPDDCRVPIRYDLLSEKDIFEIYLWHSKRDHPSWNRANHRRFAKEWVIRSPLRDPEYIKGMQGEFMNEFFVFINL